MTAANAVLVESGEVLKGASTLRRSRGRLDMQFSATGLEPNTVYTAWWVVFNRPERCTGDVCDADDIFDTPGPPRTAVLWADGLITGSDGVGSFRSTLTRRSPPGQSLFGPGLRRVRGSVVQVYLRTHGAPIAGEVADQISTYAGGCETNVCEDVQVATHLPDHYW